MDDPPFRAALVGNFDSSEMAAIRPAVFRLLSGWEVREFSGLEELNAAAQTAGDFPDLILVSQRFRDEYSAEAVRQGLGNYPVARWICVCGAWCESEGRHGSRWPMAVRIPLRFLETRLASEAAVIQGQTPALPFTASRDEVFEFDTAQKFPLAPEAGIKVCVLSPDKEFAAWLSDLCRQAGYQVIPMKDSLPVNVLIVDLDPLTNATKEEIQRFKEHQPTARLMGLMGILLPEDRVSPQSGVLVALLPKLAPAAEILNVVREASQG
jgi:hypothetical protein